MEERAVSPIVGVVLVIAIAVAVSSVVSIYAFGFGSSDPSTGNPTVSLKGEKLTVVEGDDLTVVTNNQTYSLSSGDTIIVSRAVRTIVRKDQTLLRDFSPREQTTPLWTQSGSASNSTSTFSSDVDTGPNGSVFVQASARYGSFSSETALIARYTSNGTEVWETEFSRSGGLTNNTHVRSVDVRNNRSVYAFGNTDALFLARLNLSGSVQYKIENSSQKTNGTLGSVRTGPSGDAFTIGHYNTTNNTYDVLVHRHQESDGSLKWSTRVNQSLVDIGYDLSVTSSNVYAIFLSNETATTGTKSPAPSSPGIASIEKNGSISYNETFSDVECNRVEGEIIEGKIYVVCESGSKDEILEISKSGNLEDKIQLSNLGSIRDVGTDGSDLSIASVKGVFRVGTNGRVRLTRKPNGSEGRGTAFAQDFLYLSGFDSNMTSYEVRRYND